MNKKFTSYSTEDGTSSLSYITQLIMVVGITRLSGKVVQIDSVVGGPCGVG